LLKTFLNSITWSFVGLKIARELGISPSTVSKALTQENLDEQKALVEKHIEMEAELIKKIGKMLPSVKDNKVKLLLDAILADEKRHHGLLKQVLEILVKGEAITESDWWDILWKDVPFHGAPGG
jgi:rubrerythrin